MSSNRFDTKEFKQYYLDLYYSECKKYKVSYKKPLYLFSFYTFLAYHNIWILIHRATLTEAEMTVINQLGCYKATRKELRKKYKSVQIQVC